MLKIIRIIISIILILFINNVNIILKGAEIKALTININPQDNPYSKENLQKSQPKPVNNFNHEIYNYFISFVKETGNNAYNDLKQFGSNSNSCKYYYCFVNDDEKKQSTKYSQNIIDTFTKSSKKIAERVIKDKIKIDQLLEQGITLKIDLTKILSAQNTNTTKPTNKYINNKIRYTAVLKNIIDHNNHHNKYASLYHNDIEAHIYNKDYAETQWIILPIEENPQDNIFNFTEPKESEVVANEIYKHNKFSIPKLSFNTNIKTSKQVLNPTFNNATFFLISLEQEEGLYFNQMELNLNMKLVNIQHTFKIPLYKNFYILQNYDKKFTLTQTALKNINLNKNITAEINYIHKEQQYLFVTSYTKLLYNLRFKSQINTNNKASTKIKEMYWLELNAKL